MKVIIISVVLCFITKPIDVSAHARLMEPPSRSSMWRVGFPTRKNFDDNALYCGGMQVQWKLNSGKCGICGDPWQIPHPRPNEAGGIYGTGIITRQYKVGQVIEATVDVTTNHKGYFEFRLCPNNNPKKEVQQQCLDKHLLPIVESSSTKYYISDKGNGRITVHLKLPKGMSCTQCVLQWTYVAGNNWGICEDKSGRLGCGPQETFRGCSDIAIGAGKDYNGIDNEISPADENDIGSKNHENDIDSKNHENDKSSKRPSHPVQTPARPVQTPARPVQTPANSPFPAFPSTPQNPNNGKPQDKLNPWNIGGHRPFSFNFGNSNTLPIGGKPNSHNDVRKNLIPHLRSHPYVIVWSTVSGRNISHSKGI